MLGAIAVAFTSCSDDDNGPTSQAITISHSAVPAGAEEVRNMRVVVWNEEDEAFTVVYTTLTALGFTLLLDATPHASTLADLGDARVAEFVNIEGFSTNDGTFEDDYFLGEFWNERIEGAALDFITFTEHYWYADRDLVVQGTAEEWTFNLNLRQGWNRVFSIIDVTVTVDEENPFDFDVDMTVEFTSTPVPNLSWVFDADGNAGNALTTATTSAEVAAIEKVREVRSRGINALQMIR